MRSSEGRSEFGVQRNVTLSPRELARSLQFGTQCFCNIYCALGLGMLGRCRQYVSVCRLCQASCSTARSPSPVMTTAIRSFETSVTSYPPACRHISGDLIFTNTALVEIRQSVYRFGTGWTVRRSNPVGDNIQRTRPDRPCGPTSLLYNGYRVFVGGKAAGAWR